MRKLSLIMLIICNISSIYAENSHILKPTTDEFYVYEDAGSRLNHGIPSGWMGSYKSLKFNQGWAVNPKSGKTCIQIVYDVNKDSDTLWTGIYWQHPAQNWGNKKQALDLAGFKKLTFWARGYGYIGKFGVGGITGQTEEGDSAEAFIESIDLTLDWKRYEIDLNGYDLSHIIGPFLFATSADYNDKDVMLYLDDIKFEK